MTDITAAPVSRVRWSRAVRLIRTIHPPIDLFEDIADPADWPGVISLEQKTNPRIAQAIGALDLVPVDRRVGGPGTSYLMAPFTHVSPDRATRFSPKGFGVLYIAQAFETALAETIHHFENFMRRTDEPPSIEQFRELTFTIDTRLHDIRSGDPAWDPLLHPTDYTASQAAADTLRANDGQGIVYPSVRHPGGECAAFFYPDLVKVPTPAAHFEDHWNGERVDWVRDGRTVYRVA